VLLTGFLLPFNKTVFTHLQSKQSCLWALTSSDGVNWSSNNLGAQQQPYSTAQCTAAQLADARSAVQPTLYVMMLTPPES
jgi:hypothetical protein